MVNSLAIFWLVRLQFPFIATTSSTTYKIQNNTCLVVQNTKIYLILIPNLISIPNTRTYLYIYIYIYKIYLVRFTTLHLAQPCSGRLLPWLCGRGNPMASTSVVADVAQLTGEAARGAPIQQPYGLKLAGWCLGHLEGGYRWSGESGPIGGPLSLQPLPYMDVTRPKCTTWTGSHRMHCITPKAPNSREAGSNPCREWQFLKVVCPWASPMATSQLVLPMTATIIFDSCTRRAKGVTSHLASRPRPKSKGQHQIWLQWQIPLTDLKRKFAKKYGFLDSNSLRTYWMLLIHVLKRRVNDVA